MRYNRYPTLHAYQISHLNGQLQTQYIQDLSYKFQKTKIIYSKTKHRNIPYGISNNEELLQDSDFDLSVCVYIYITMMQQQSVISNTKPAEM
jgi:preprotein translocase subunit SecB